MKVILQKPVERLGDPGDVADVADGYARNFLIPRGLAVRAEKGASAMPRASRGLIRRGPRRRRASSRRWPPGSSRPPSS